ncbi:MAG TPA: hypothetical protein VGH38_14290 [Bryobacteraceae bacterium]|jgi:hypothetical protein
MTLYLGIARNSGIDWTDFPWFAIVNYLTDWLNSCCGDGGDPVRVLTVNQPQSRMTTSDGLVYLVGYPSDSVVSRVGAPASGDLHVGQTSALGGEMISEVYVNIMHEYGIAATIYHELLHNKFRLSIDIHRTPDGNFTSATAPYSLGGPSDADQGLMCRALQEKSRQFQGGF